MAVFEQPGAFLAQIIRAELALTARVRDGESGSVAFLQRVGLVVVTSMIDNFNTRLVA
jgi:hypothetical protein